MNLNTLPSIILSFFNERGYLCSPLHQIGIADVEIGFLNYHILYKAIK